MVALLVGLKWRLLLGSLRADTWQLVGTALGALVGLGLTIAGVLGVVSLRAAEPLTAQQVLTAGGTLLLLGWTLVPLLTFGVDETLDPARFALLPLSGPRLVPGLAVAALIGVPGVATALVLAATLVTWSRGPLELAVAVPSAVVGLGLCIVLSRLFTTLGARALATRRAREAGAAFGVLIVSSVGLVPVLVSEQLRRFDDLGAALLWLGWTPLGWAFAAPGDVATGHLARGLVRLGLATVMLVASGLAWGGLLGRALENQTGDTSGPRRTRTPGRRAVLDRLPGTPWGAVAARSLRYWRRDSRYVTLFSSVIIASVVPAVAIRAAASADGPPSALIAAVGPFVATMIGLSASNDLGYDGTAFATHLITGVRGRDDRAGRILALLAWAVPGVAVVAVAGCVVAGYAFLAPGVIGLSLAMLLGSVSAAVVGGALAPYPMPEPGANPFRGNSGANARALFAQAACGGVAVACATPAGTAFVAALFGWVPGLWVALVLGPVVGAGALAVGIVAGGQIVDARGPEILAAVRRSQ